MSAETLTMTYRSYLYKLIIQTYKYERYALTILVDIRYMYKKHIRSENNGRQFKRCISSREI